MKTLGKKDLNDLTTSIKSFRRFCENRNPGTYSFFFTTYLYHVPKDDVRLVAERVAPRGVARVGRELVVESVDEGKRPVVDRQAQNAHVVRVQNPVRETDLRHWESREIQVFGLAVFGALNVEGERPIVDSSGCSCCPY